MQDKPSIANVLDFWYSKKMSKHWFSSTLEIDQTIKTNLKQSGLVPNLAS